MSLNIRKFYLLSFFSGFIFTYTIQAIFLLSRGITPTELALFASLTVITSTLMEIPTGFIADKFGRKYSVALSYLLDVIVFVTLVFVQNFILLALVALIKGTSMALESGAYESLIYEEIQTSDNEDKYLQTTTRGTNIAIGIGVFATFLGPILYTVNHTIPFILSGLVYFVMALIVLTFDERKSSHEVRQNLKMLSGIKTIIKIRPIALIVLIDLLILIFVNIYYQVAFFPKLSGLGFDVKYFGIVDSITLAITSVLLYLVPKVSWKNEKLTLVLFTLTPAIMFILFGLSPVLIPTLLFGVLFDPAWNLRRHIIPTITNKYFNNQNRALSISSMSFVSNLGAALLVPLFTFLFTKSYLFSFVPLLGIIILLYLFNERNQ